MKELLSPKQVASSIGVSESSLKRWCDQGVITTERTPGGHRRIRIGEVVRFLREQQHPLIRPEVLGLPPGDGKGPRSIDKAKGVLVEALKAGQVDQTRRLVIDLYLAGNSIGHICEQLVAPTLHALGDGWECGDVEIYQEHRACEVLNRVLYDLRAVLPPPADGAPLAMGGTPPGDNYRLASLMVELTVVESGWEAVSLGNSLPFETLADAACRHHPRLFWLSFSHVDDLATNRDGFRHFLERTPKTMQIVIGGQQADADWAAEDDRVHHCPSLSALKALLDSLPPADKDQRTRSASVN